MGNGSSAEAGKRMRAGCRAGNGDFRSGTGTGGKETAQAEKEEPTEPETQAAPKEQAAAEERDISEEKTGSGEQTATAEPAAAEAAGNYTVQRGDSLAKIARRFYGSTAYVSKICDLNQIEDPDRITPGQNILLP